MKADNGDSTAVIFVQKQLKGMSTSLGGHLNENISCILFS